MSPTRMVPVVVWLVSRQSAARPETGGQHVATFIDITQRKIEESLRHRARATRDRSRNHAVQTTCGWRWPKRAPLWQ